MRRFVLSLIAVPAAFLAACSSSPSPPAPPLLVARSVVEVARWEAFDGEQRLGQLILLEIKDPKGPVRFYQIQDAAGRLVGSATENGRFSRRVPFQDEEEDLGVWRRERGVGELLGLGRAIELRDAPLSNQPAEASARRR